jgi:flagellar biosynthesis/type III secretory pathway M-ring protein FliF/YscJ
MDIKVENTKVYFDNKEVKGLKKWATLALTWLMIPISFILALLLVVWIIMMCITIGFPLVIAMILIGMLIMLIGAIHK